MIFIIRWATVFATTTMFQVLLISIFIFIFIGSSSLSWLLNATGCLHALAQASAAAAPDYSQVLHLFPEALTDDTGASRTCSCALGVCPMYRRSADRKLELYFPSWCQCRSARASRRSESRSCFLTDTEPLGVAVGGCGCDPVAATLCIEVVGRKAKRRSERALLLRGLHRSRCCCGS